jgi:hypothetical protein
VAGLDFRTDPPRRRIASLLSNTTEIPSLVSADNQTVGGYLKFKNDRGAAEIYIGLREFKCIGEPSRRAVYSTTPTPPERSRNRSAEVQEGDTIMPRDVEPFYLIVRDKDNGTFSVEGPMTDDRPWNHAIVIAQKSGRQVQCFIESGSSPDDIARNWLQRYSAKQVMPGEIVHL